MFTRTRIQGNPRYFYDVNCFKNDNDNDNDNNKNTINNITKVLK